MVLVQNKYKNTLVGVLRTQITFVTHSSPSCYVTLRTQVIRLNSGNLGLQTTDSGVFINVNITSCRDMYITILQNRSLFKHMGQGRIGKTAVHILFVGITVEKIFGSVTLMLRLVSPRPVILLLRSVNWIYSVPFTTLCGVCSVHKIHFSVLILCSSSITFPRRTFRTVAVISSLLAIWIG